MRKTLLPPIMVLAMAVGIAACGGSSGGTSSSSSSGSSSSTSSSTTVDEMFVLGAWVNADPYAWGDITGMGSNSFTTIDNIAADMAAMGLNTVWIAGLSSGYDGEATYGRFGLIEEWLEAGADHGLKVVIEGSGLPYAIPREDPNLTTITRDTVIPTWQEIATRFRTHAALLAYCPVEEIDDNVPAETTTLTALDAVGDAVAVIDSTHPVVTIHIATWFNVAQTELSIRGSNMRVEIADFYPFGTLTDWTDLTSGNTFATPDEATDAIIDTTARHVALADSAAIPMWLFAQANSSTWVRRLNGLSSPAESRANFRMPTVAEMRFQIWGPIIAGARGVIFFPYNSQPDYSAAVQATLTDWEYGTGLRTLAGQTTQSHQGLSEAGARISSQLELLGRIRPSGSLLESGYLLGRLFLDSSRSQSYVILVNRDVVNQNSMSTNVVPGSIGDSTTLIDVFTGQSYTRSTINSLTLSAGNGTILKVGS